SSIAMPRTIALLASELWTAPEADPATQLSFSDSPPEKVNNTEVEQEKATLTSRTLQESYRTGGDFGFSLGIEDRGINRTGSYLPYSSGFLSWTLSAEWAARPDFGVYAALSHANSVPEDTYDSSSLSTIGIYDRGELGVYVPVLSGSWRIDMRFGGGYDKQYQPGILKLDYEYLEVGADVLYFMHENFVVTGLWSHLAILDGPRNTGYKTQLGAIWRLRPFLLEGKLTVSHADIHFRGATFGKSTVRGELGLRYSY
ncbi:MAG: hypothetical protein JKY56_15260, partial [Kofleriaceae bacterium]|nr:hypothetical protein [Kofleriaceae bacterium]